MLVVHAGVKFQCPLARVRKVCNSNLLPPALARYKKDDKCVRCNINERACSNMSKGKVRGALGEGSIEQVYVCLSLPPTEHGARAESAEPW